MKRYYVEYKSTFVGEPFAGMVHAMSRSYSTLASAKRYARKVAFETGYARVRESVLDGYCVVFETRKEQGK